MTVESGGDDALRALHAPEHDERFRVIWRLLVGCAKSDAYGMRSRFGVQEPSVRDCTSYGNAAR